LQDNGGRTAAGDGSDYFFFVDFLAAAFALAAGLALAADFGAGFLAMSGLEGESSDNSKAWSFIARAVSAPVALSGM
jgi:hypothetical protein